MFQKLTERINNYIRHNSGNSAIWEYMRGMFRRLDEQDKKIQELENKILVYERVLEVLKVGKWQA